MMSSLFFLVCLGVVAVAQQPAPAAPPPPAGHQFNDTLCEQFSRVFSDESDVMFTSPLYPKEYPPKLQCIRVIEAPLGHVIRLHFVETFLLEFEVGCRYDYLEIRDGEFGYSTMIGKLCGDSPPSYIESSGRHLWLRFNSDNDIEYVGFKVHVSFISTVPPGQTPTDDSSCSTVYFNMLEGWLNSSAISEEVLARAHSLGTPVDCTWVINAKEDEKIYLQFPQYSLAHPNDCEVNFVEVYGGKTELEGDEGRIKHFCGSEAEAATSRKNIMHVRFLSGVKEDSKDGGRVKTDSFLEAYFSVFRELKEGQSCVANKEFDCTDNSCIDYELRCNDGKANCKLRNDEESCDQNKGRFKLTTDILIISFLGILLMAGMCSGLMLNIYRKLREDKLWPGNSSSSNTSSHSDQQQQGADPEVVVEVMHPVSAEDNKSRRDDELSCSPELSPSSSVKKCPTTLFPSSGAAVVELLRRVEVRDTGCQATPPHVPVQQVVVSPPPLYPSSVLAHVPRRKTHADVLVVNN